MKCSLCKKRARWQHKYDEDLLLCGEHKRKYCNLNKLNKKQQQMVLKKVV